jgi:hypothetical protein
MQKVCGVVSVVFACVLFVVSAANFWSLESRTIAPSVGELGGYVGVPIVLGLVAMAGGVVCISRAIDHEEWLKTLSRMPKSYEDPKPNVAPRINPVTPNDRQATRSRTWAILDELSESLRSDDEASEALYVVRERYHRIQFGPVDSPGTVPDKPAV